ncbi:MAG TPA: type II secretion system F family protein [Patescibacteria group bacterium]|nr:type II secretion system F family protein [Patescibacteria group bacterium]
MAHYHYRAKKGPSETVEGSLEAQSREEAIEKLSLLGYLPVQIEERQDAAGSSRAPEAVQFGSQAVKLRDISIFSGQLSSLIRSGVTILKALGIIAEQTENKYFRYVLNGIADDIKVGRTFSESLLQYPHVFSTLYVAIIKAGEDTGTLHASLERITAHLRKQEGILSKVKTALVYPALMTIVGAGTVVFMLMFVIPRIKDIFTSMGQQLPMPTRILIATSDILRVSWFWLLIAGIAAFSGIKRLLRTKKETVSAVTLKIPLYGSFIRKAEIAQVSRTMELSMKSGINILRAMELSIPILDNEIIRKELLAAYEEVKQGGSLGRNLKRTAIFPAFVTNFIIIGEESGKLQEVFGEIADYFEKDTDETLRLLTAQLEPLMILIIGAVLGYVVIAMLLPIFQINLMVQ